MQCLLARRTAVSNLTSRRIIAKTGKLVHRILLEGRDTAQELGNLAESIRAVSTSRQPFEGQRGLIQHEPDVVLRSLSLSQIQVLVNHGSEAAEVGVRRTGPDLREQSGAEWRNLVEVEGSRGSMADVPRESVGTVLEVIKAQRGDNRVDDIIVRHVHVQRLSERESGSVVVVRVVDARVRRVDQLGLQPRCEFEEIANALGATGG